MSRKASIKMEYIQKLFLEVQNYMQQKPELDQLIAFLEKEPPEFRSVSFESASMELALQDLSIGSKLHNWKKLYTHFGKVHSFYLYIGLGWAFAKTANFPSSNWKPLHSLMQLMVFDGIGYYYGLFRGRKTVRKQMIPEEIDQKDYRGFDQGLGRRLWYIAKGEVQEVTKLIQVFPVLRQPDLWRGVGIACGYVGGNKKKDLELLAEAAAEWKQQLCSGVTLAGMARLTSNSVTEDIKRASRILCDKTMEEIEEFKTNTIDKIDLEGEGNSDNWITHLESWLV